MNIIVNKEIPEEALIKLENLGNVHYFHSNEITYPSISGHPDVFFCQIDNALVVAPNTPEYFKHKLKKSGITINEGVKKLGLRYPETATYNAVITDIFYIHNMNISDKKIKETCSERKHVHVNQAYTRCNLLPLNNNKFITSDLGIYKTLKDNNMEVLFVSPKSIKLPGFKNGFFGGVCGTYNGNVYIIGDLNFHSDRDKIKDFINSSGNNIIELYNGQLFDAGSLIFIDGKS
jgi:Family of unknown function (DUF6873)